MVEHISAQQARKLVSDLGWRMIKRGSVWYSRNMRWQVWSAGTFYKRQRCSPTW